MPLVIDSLAVDRENVELKLVLIGGKDVSPTELLIEGEPAKIRTGVDGKNLIVYGLVKKGEKRPRTAKVTLLEGKRVRTETLKLQGAGLVDLVFGPGEKW